MTTPPRIALIHALKHSIAPIEAAFAKAWPEARLMNLLDDSLSADLARDGKLNDAMTKRFLALGHYAAATCADAGAQAERSHDRTGGDDGPAHRPALDFRADPGLDAAGISGLRPDRTETRRRRAGRARPRRPRYA